MSDSEIKRVVLIGAGRVAWHLGWALARHGIEIIQVYNRTPVNGEKLALKLGARYLSDASKITPDADLLLITVTDSAIGEVASMIPGHTGMLVHVSGSVDIDILSAFTTNYGVFYPVQTFSYEKQVEFKDIPVCLEACTSDGLILLKNLAYKITGLVYELDSNQRRQLHLAAVFASNFSNFMYVIAEELLKKGHIPSDLIMPLIKQTGNPEQSTDFFLRQTGPAVRNDQKVMDMNRKLLSDNPQYLEIYNLITKNILEYNIKHGKL